MLSPQARSRAGRTQAGTYQAPKGPESVATAHRYRMAAAGRDRAPAGGGIAGGIVGRWLA
jgi:hypothetical protein